MSAILVPTNHGYCKPTGITLKSMYGRGRYLQVLYISSYIFFWVAFHGFGCHRPHVVVDNCELHEWQEYEYRTWRHPHVDCFHVGHRRKQLLGLRVLRGCERKRLASPFSWRQQLLGLCVLRGCERKRRASPFSWRQQLLGLRVLRGCERKRRASPFSWRQQLLGLCVLRGCERKRRASPSRILP